MGIRVHKVLGYGLADVEVASNGYDIDDPRINEDSVLFDWEQSDKNLAAYRKYIYAKNEKARKAEDYRAMNVLDGWFFKDEMRKPKNKRRLRGLDDCVVHQSEYGLANVLHIRPASCPDWFRHDDHIDYIEESKHHGCEHRIEIFETPLYPFSTYMDSRTGEVVDGFMREWLILRNDEENLLDHLNNLAKGAGFEDHEAAKKFVVPSIPEPIRDLVEFGNLFTDETVVRQLRPMLYVYWC